MIYGPHITYISLRTQNSKNWGHFELHKIVLTWSLFILQLQFAPAQLEVELWSSQGISISFELKKNCTFSRDSNATSKRCWPYCGEGYVSQYFEDHKDPFDDDLWPPPKIELKHDLTQITQPLSKIINLFLSKKHFR